MRIGWARGLGAGLIVVAAALWAPTLSAAQTSATDKASDQASTPVEGVVVTAPRRPVVKDKARATGQFIHTHTAVSPIGEVARWDEPVCAKTEGLPEGYNAFITNHLNLVAASVGAPTRPVTATKPCDINVLIIFTPEPQKLLDEVARDHPQLLGFHYYSQRKRLKTFNHPIESWYATESVSHGGEHTLDSPWDNVGQVVSQPYHSRIVTSERSVFKIVLIVADSNKVADSKIGTIADFIAMLALAQPERHALESCEELASILDYMSPDCTNAEKPETLTAVDLAYLRALYRVSLGQSVEGARGEIFNQMKKELGVN